MITEPPVPVGYSFPVDVKYLSKPCHDLGGYTVVEDEDQGILIIGYKETNIFTQPIGQVSVTPVDTRRILNTLRDETPEDQRATSIYWTFDYEPESIVFFVTYGDATWVFNDMQNAFSLAALIVQIKTQALSEYLKGDSLWESATTES